MALGAGAVLGLLARRGLSRLDLVDARLREAGRVTAAGARLQRRALEALPPTVPEDDPMVGDLRLQLAEARRLEAHLPPSVILSLAELEGAVARAPVRRSDLVEAAELLEAVAGSESLAREQILAGARTDLRAERDATFVGLLALTLLALVGVWVAPRAPPFRALTRLWLGGILARRATLARGERMALAGEAAAGLAHELRNPLAGVTLGLQNLERERTELASRIHPLVAELQRVTRTLERHLQAFRPPPEPPTEVRVDGLLEELAELLRYEAAPGVALVVAASPGLRCRTRPDPLRQIVLNLGLNALHALESRGGTVRFHASRADGSLTLEVMDDGPGFPEAVLAGTLPPLSSSRPGGVGLGLRLARRMTVELGGALTLSNRPSGGASAEIRLPCAPEAP